MTAEVLRKLEEAAALDASDEEMCSYANIAESTYYAYCKKNPQFSERIRQLKMRPVLKARNAVITKMQESYHNAMDYLSRKRHKEFGEKSELDVTSGGQQIAQVVILPPRDDSSNSKPREA